MRRRNVMKAIGGIATLGISGAAAAGSPEKEENPDEVTRPPGGGSKFNEKNNIVSGGYLEKVSSTLGYAGSELQEEWVGNEKKERWAHFYEVATHAEERDAGTYSIFSQEFTCAGLGGSGAEPEFHSYPSAGTSAWPGSGSGSWSNVAKTLVEESISNISSVVDVVDSAAEIIDAYNSSNFDSSPPDNLEFQANYSGNVKHAASHSVNFKVHTKPNTSTGFKIESTTDEHIGSQSGGIWCIYMEDDQTQAGPWDRSQSVGFHDTLDEMSDSELADYGIKRMNPSKMSATQRKENRFDLAPGETTYIADIPMEIEAKSINREGDKREVQTE